MNLLSFTAMKMEMVVQSPRAGVVKTLNINPGMKLEGEDLILTFE
jgi:pyruvate carboxylase